MLRADSEIGLAAAAVAVAVRVVAFGPVLGVADVLSVACSYNK